MIVLIVGLICVKVMSPEQRELPKEAGPEFHFTRNRGRRAEPDSQKTPLSMRSPMANYWPQLATGALATRQLVMTVWRGVGVVHLPKFCVCKV